MSKENDKIDQLEKDDFALNKEEFRDVFMRFDTTNTLAIWHLFVPAATDSTQFMPWILRMGDLSMLVMIQSVTSKHPFFTKCTQMLNLNPIFCL